MHLDVLCPLPALVQALNLAWDRAGRLSTKGTGEGSGARTQNFTET